MFHHGVFFVSDVRKERPGGRREGKKTEHEPHSIKRQKEKKEEAKDRGTLFVGCAAALSLAVGRSVENKEGQA